jgi:peptidoglycan/LPS O-acetylase OafA/YrhL
VVYYFAWPLLLWVGGWSAWRALVIGFPVTLLLAGGLLGSWKILLNEPADSILMPIGLISAQFILWLGGAWLAQSWESLLKYVKAWFAWAGLVGVLLCYGINVGLLYLKAPLWAQLLAGYAAVPFWLALIGGSHAWTCLLGWKRTATWLGLLSYPLYIMHQVILDVLTGAGRGGFLSDLPITLAATVMLLAVMLVMAFLGIPIEAGLLRWRSRWLNRVYQKGHDTKKASVG